MRLHQYIIEMMDQVIVSGSSFLKREKRALVRRWNRAMLLPETVLLAGLIIISAVMMDTTNYRPGQQAQASSPVTVIEDGVPTIGDKRKQRTLQGRLHDRPENLMKLSGSDVVTAFSYPDLQRQEGDMMILQFRGNDCVLDIFFSDHGKATTHYEFRARQMAALKGSLRAEKVRPRDCVNDILKSRRV